MVPHFAPPFGLARALAAWLSPMRAPDASELEREYAAAFGVRDAVIIPSVRAGILMLLRFAIGEDALVLGPSYTCMVVHEAMVMSGRRFRCLDPESGSYSPAAADVCRFAEPGMALVLSEMYGIPTNAELIRMTDRLDLGLRIHDMAMSIPERDRLQSLRPADVVLVSFGFGKSLCAGGGAIALLSNREVADQLRASRAEALTRAEPDRRSDLRALQSIAARTRIGCTASHLAATHNAKRTSEPPAAGPPTGKTAAGPRLGHEWSHRMTAMQRRLALRNLKHVSTSARRRRTQAGIYLDVLGAGPVTAGVSREALPQSHFPIRIKSERRAALTGVLNRHGFAAGSEFPFSGVIPAGEFPGAVRIAEEIVTLPMGEQISDAEVHRVATLVAANARP